MNPLGWVIQKALAAPLSAVEQTIVDCGTCPVNILCLVGRGGNGLKYSCCGMTTVPVEALSGESLLLMVDCSNNRFEDTRRTGEFGNCPLCGSGALETEMRGWLPGTRWLPTVHATHPVTVRLEAWRRAVPVIRERIAHDAKIKERGAVKP